MKTIRILTLISCVAALTVPTISPAAAEHHGSDWLVDGQLEGTLTFDYSEGETTANGTWSRKLSYTANLPSGEITNFSYSYSEATSQTEYGPSGEPYTCNTSTQETNISGAEPALEDFPSNVRPSAYASGGHYYGIIIDPVRFTLHHETTRSGCLNNTPNEGDFQMEFPQTFAVNCAADASDPYTCTTEDRRRLQGSWEYQEPDIPDQPDVSVSWDLIWTPPEDCAPSGTRTAQDRDGDRLPNGYESTVLFTDPDDPDTDADCFGDAIEEASGSAPNLALETPNTLDDGGDPLILNSSGDTGSTCGSTKFKWVTPAAESIGVPADKPACIFLYSNPIARKVVRYVVRYDTSVTAALQKMTAPYLKEIYGRTAVNWVEDRTVDDKVWGTQRYLKATMRAGLNLSRLNAIFTAGRVAGLNAIALGGVWKLNQIQNNSACIQVRIGATSTGSTKMSWSLVYSADQVTDPKISFAGVFKKKDGVIVDNAVKMPINLQCDGGYVVANGGSASKVFDGAISHIF